MKDGCDFSDLKYLLNYGALYADEEEKRRLDQKGLGEGKIKNCRKRNEHVDLDKANM